MPPEEKTPEAKQAELMAAVDTAVAEATPADVREAANDPNIEAEPEGEVADPPAAEEPEKKDEPPPEPDKEPPVEAKDKPPPEEPAKPPVAEKPPPAAPPAPPDPVNDPIPESVKGRTRARMESLVTTAKSLTGERDAARRDLTELYTAIEDTKAPPKQFADTMHALKSFNSPRAEDRKAAAKYFRELADTVANDLGETPPGQSPLDAHPDLQKRVDDLEISRELAIELAGARNKTAADGRRAAADRQREEQDAARGAVIERARGALNSLGQQLYAVDPTGFTRKNAVLVPKMREMVATLDPSLWVSTYRMLYDNLGVMAAPPANPSTASRPGRAPAGTGANQPMRPRPTAGGGAVQEPKSALEAMDLALRTSSG